MYNFNTHKHNYSIWAAARASQRGFTSTKNIKIAIEDSDLRVFSETDEPITDSQFELFHRNCCHQILSTFNNMSVSGATYGRAAKIIAIYLKTSVIIANRASCAKSNVIHSPIDNILLTRLSKKYGLNEIKKIHWTSLTEAKYWSLVLQLRSFNQHLNWTVEEFWSPE